MPDKLKIAFVAYDFPEYSIRHVNEMTEAGEVLLMLPQQTAPAYLPLLNPAVRFEAFDKPRLRQPVRQLRTAIGLVRRLRAFQPDVIHFQSGHMYFNLCMPLLSRFPLVITIHDARQHLGDHESGHTPQWIMDFGFCRADQVIVHGRSLIPVVTGELGFVAEQVHLIPHVAIGENAGAVPITDEAQRVLFFGRIWEYKGLEYLIRAAPWVTAECPQARFVIAGRGEDLQRYRQLMHDPHCFEIHNDWISDADRARLFAGCSLVVLPYIEASQSGVIPIAYTYAKPVVVSHIGGLPDMVDQGRTGRLVPPRDERALAQAIIELLQDRRLRMTMGQAGRQKLVSECAPAVVASQTLTVYHQAIAHHRQRHRRPAANKEPVRT